LELAGSGISLAALSACAPTGTSASATSAAPVASAGGSPAAIVPAFAKDPVSLTFFHYAGSNQEIIPQELVKKYMAENPNVKIETMQGSNAATFPAILAAYKTTGKPTVQAGYFNPDASTKGDLEDLWLPLDPSHLPNSADIPKAYWRQGNKGVGWGITALGIPYRKDLVTPTPASWLDLLDPKFKGHVGLPDAPLAFTFGGMIVINRILGGNETTLDKGFKAFADAAKAGQFHSIFPGNQQLKDLMVKGDIRILGYSYGNVAPWRAEGAPIEYAVPKEGQTAFPLYFQILRGGTPAQVYHSEQLINRLLEPATLGRYCELVLTSPTNPKVALPDKLKSDPAFQAGNVANAIQLDWNTVAQQTAAWQDRFNREIKANLK
jgi:putative spermidine/putrescine transport system substrate-binding protein